MKLLDAQGAVLETMSVSAPKGGRRFSALVLDREDFAKLTDLLPSQLHDWMMEWMCGFPPANQPGRERHTIEENFQHFLSYTSGKHYQATEAERREAYYAGADVPPPGQ